MPRDFVVPASLAERASEWFAGGSPDGPAARSAATVVLVRDGAASSGVEVFLMRRQMSMVFAAGMVVFPGGGVDTRDADADVPWAGPPATWWADAMGTDEARARAIVCAAVRETFEECGLLLASVPGADDVVDVDGPDWELDRQRLLTRDVALSELLAERGVVLRADLLRPWAHWTTPHFEVRRYDTWFLLARMPAGRQARHVSTEADAADWSGAAQVLAGFSAGTVGLLPPTLVTIEELSAAADVDALWVAERLLSEVSPVLVREAGDVVLRAEVL